MGDPLRERFDITGLKETCPLTGSGAFASGRYDNFITPEAPLAAKSAVNFEKAAPAVSTTPGGP